MIARKLLASVALSTMLTATIPLSAWAQNVVTMTTGQIFRSIDPAKVTDYTDYMGVVNLYDGLTSVEPDGSIVPALAESWEVSPDAREVTYKLRDDATFSDGSPVEAGDVVYSVERLLRINQGPASMLAGVLTPGSVTAVDNKTVKFTLAKNFAPFLAVVPAIFILNEEAVKPHEGDDDAQSWLATNAAGAGPFTLKAYDRGTRLTVVRNEDYYKGFPENPIDEVRWIVVNDEASVRAMGASGELTMTGPFQSPDTYDALEGMGYKIENHPTSSTLYLKLNNQVTPTDDVHIRRAIALATDYETIREVIFPGNRLTTPLPDTFKQFHADDVPEPKYDLEAARAEVAKSKYAGQPISITLGFLTGIKYQEEISLLMQANLEQIGFTVTQAVNPWNRVTELATKVETTPAVNQIFFSATYPSPDSMFHTQYHSSAAGTWASMEWINDPEVDKLIEEARGTGELDKQIDIYKELQHKLVDMQSDVFLLTQVSKHALNKCLEGLSIIPMRSFGYDFSRYSWNCD
ncbi:ABC transporter substrate-binding protein [Aquamicrobium sp. LC103]|uniref:ABC transporter substrate-binding protein n=1 Tax=Aquamicrobium sp. LC103 TaxID=1120658 RepID=UPI00063ED14F|nr:ABC transporter substrate-binding protein [Aquamicrobium sp. LC103]TKT78243.1 ABC transporter substrate-binding protein [Aquamicrobium sp. LC103]